MRFLAFGMLPAQLMKRTLVAVLVFAAMSCGSEPPGERLGSDRQRLTTAAPAADLASAVQSSNAFALDLHRDLSTRVGGNTFISPVSVTLALAMAYAGAGGATAGAFEHTLHIAGPSATYHHAMNDLDRQLTSRGAKAQGTNGQPFKLDVTNQLFADKGFSFQAPFLDTLAQEYGSDVRRLDFVKASEDARSRINGWVSGKTAGRITELLARGAVTSDTRAVLVNAVYFNAAWSTKFDPASTRKDTFHALDGALPVVDFMFKGGLSAQAATVDGVEVVALPYSGGELSMLVLMPPAGQFATFEQELSERRLADLVGALAPASLNLSLPKFSVRTSTSLKDALTALGLGVAFADTADFSAMSAEGVSMSEVVHQAWVRVDESGTEAAAATAATFDRTSAPVDTRTIVVDRPFVYAIRDDATGALVFVGRLVTP